MTVSERMFYSSVTSIVHGFRDNVLVQTGNDSMVISSIGGAKRSF